MKKGILIIFLLAALFNANVFSQIEVYSTGYAFFKAGATDGNGVWIKRDSPTSYDARIQPYWNHALSLGKSDCKLYDIYTYRLCVNGSWISSDARLIENIKPIQSSLSKIKALKPVKFDYKMDKEFKGTQKNKEEFYRFNKNNFGFLAQDVKEILPNLVTLEDDGMYSVNYVGMIPLLVESIQEQEELISQLNAEIKDLKMNCCNDNGKIKSATKGGSGSNNNAEAVLYQNTPNPFASESKIECYIPDDFNSALIGIYDLNGTQIK